MRKRTDSGLFSDTTKNERIERLNGFGIGFVSWSGFEIADRCGNGIDYLIENEILSGIDFGIDLRPYHHPPLWIV